MARRTKVNREDRNGDDTVEVVRDENIGDVEKDEDVVEIPEWALKRRGNRKAGRRGGSHAAPAEEGKCKDAFLDMEEHQSSPLPQAITGKKRHAASLEIDDGSSLGAAKRIRNGWKDIGEPRLGLALEDEPSGGLAERIRNSSNETGDVLAVASDDESSADVGKAICDSWNDTGDRLAVALGAACLSPKRDDSCYTNRNPQEQKAFPTLPQEPEPEADGICRICVRFPDGKRVQRRFFLSDPIQYVWSLCALENSEVAEGKTFHLMRAIPGSFSILYFDIESTISEAGIAGSLLSLAWD